MNKLLLIVSLSLLSACTTVTYPNGTTVTTPYVAPFYTPVYGTPGYPVPVAPYSPPGTPGAYYGYVGGSVPLVGLGVGWGNLWRGWGWGGGGCYGGNGNNWNGWNGGCHNYNSWHPCNSYQGYSGYRGYHYGH